MFNDKKNANQIMKIHSRGTFCEVLSSSFEIRKVQMNFINYNKQNKVTDKISIYLDIEKIIPLINSVKNGDFLRSFINAKQTGVYKGQQINQYTSYFMDQGGTRRNGEVISRMFKIQESRKAGSWNLYASEGPGKITGTGLIQMDGRPTKFINIPITHEQLITMMIKIEMHLQAYTNLVYMRFGDRIFTDMHSGNKDDEFTTYFYENGIGQSEGMTGGNRQIQGNTGNINTGANTNQQNYQAGQYQAPNQPMSNYMPNHQYQQPSGYNNQGMPNNYTKPQNNYGPNQFQGY